MTDQPYTGEALSSVIEWLQRQSDPAAAPPSMLKCRYSVIADTLRDYQRVLAENADLKAHEARWADTVERQRKAADRHRDERAKLEAEVAALRADKERLTVFAALLLLKLGDVDDDPRLESRCVTVADLGKTIHRKAERKMRPMRALSLAEAQSVLDRYHAAIDAARSGGEGEG